MAIITARKKTTYKTAWFFVDHTNIDKLIYDMLSSYLNNGKYTRMKELWGKYFALLYLGGYRRVEPFLLSPTIRHESIGGADFYYLKKVNAKHFKEREIIHLANGKKTWRGIGNRQLIDVIFMPANEYEAGMWRFLASGDRETLDFTPLIRDKLSVESMSGISHLFSSRFRANITDGSRVIENGGVTPHMLRHARAYDLHIIEGYPDYHVMKLMGWDTREMLDWYEDIKNALTVQEMKNVYLRKLEERRRNYTLSE